eukprot:m.196596 g.196596  ORF g.196596 m.196596 type:complete len:80 (+) comp15465_c2_seq5:1556-1795(+)
MAREAAVLACLLAVAFAASCLDEKGAPVDWWFVYKVGALCLRSFVEGDYLDVSVSGFPHKMRSREGGSSRMASGTPTAT